MFFTTGRAGVLSRFISFQYLYNSYISRFKKSMVKGLDSYEEKEDEVIKEVGRKAFESPTP